MENWRDQAACRNEDPELFFPIGTSGPALLQTEQAKAVCARCPAREQCLEWALDHGEVLVVWCGTGEAGLLALQFRRLPAALRGGA